MALNVEVLPDTPIILISVEPGSDVLRDMDDVQARVADAVAGQAEPAFLVLDLSDVMLRLDQVSLLMAKMARGSSSLLHHPNLRETVVVTRSAVIQTALGIVNGPLFDGVNLSTTVTLDEALAHCRAQGPIF